MDSDNGTPFTPMFSRKSYEEGLKDPGFLWQKAKDANERIEQRWKDVEWFQKGRRGFSTDNMSVIEKASYLDDWEKIEVEAKRIIAEAEGIGLDDAESVGKMEQLLKKVTSLVELDKHNGEGYEWVKGKEKPCINEVLLPVLFQIEQKANLQNREVALRLLLDTARLSFDEDREVNPYAEEILTSTMIIGRAESCGSVLELLSELERKLSSRSDDESVDEEEAIINFIEDQIINELEGDGEVEIDYDLIRKRAESRFEEMKEKNTDEYKRLLDIERYRMEPKYDEITLRHIDMGLGDIHTGICEGVMLTDWGERKDEAIKLLCKTMEINSSGSLDAYVRAFSYLGIDESFPYLLENLKSENVLTRRMSAEILFSLELVSLKVSSEGVHYFNKVYKLVDEHNPDFWANYYRELLSSAEGEVEKGEFEIRDRIRLLDEEGKVGLFGEQGLLVFFKLKLEGGNEQINANVSHLTAKDFFLEKADEKPEDRMLREAMLHTLLEDYAEVRDEVEERSGLKLHSLRLHEQGWFIAYWIDQKITPEEKERVVKMAKKYGTNGIKAFLTLDYGESADELLGFLESEKLAESEKVAILRNYNLLLERSFEWRAMFGESEKGLGLNFSAEIHEAMIRKSSEYLRAAIAINSNQDGGITTGELLRNMEQICFTMEKLKGLYVENSSLKLTQTQYHEGYLVKGDESTREPHASETWNFVDTKDGSTVSVTVRLIQVYDGNGEKFERRVNFKVKNKKMEMEGRIGIDMDTYLMRKGQSDREMLSLDLATGETSFKEKVYGTTKTSDVLKILEESEGGHTYLPFSKGSTERYGDIASSFRDYMRRRFGWKMSWKEKGMQTRMART